MKIGDTYYRIIRKIPATEYRAKLNSWRQDRLVICRFDVISANDHKYIGKNKIGVTNEVTLIPIKPIKICDHTVCQDCIDFDTDSLTEDEIYNNMEEFIFTDINSAERLYRRITNYKKTELNKFNIENGVNCIYPFEGVNYEV